MKKQKKVHGLFVFIIVGGCLSFIYQLNRLNVDTDLILLTVTNYYNKIQKNFPLPAKTMTEVHQQLTKIQKLKYIVFYKYILRKNYLFDFYIECVYI